MITRSFFVRALALGVVAVGASACTTVPYGVSPSAGSVYYVQDPWANVSPHAQCYRSWHACYGSPYGSPHGYGYYQRPPRYVKPPPSRPHPPPSRPQPPQKPPPSKPEPPVQAPKPPRLIRLGTSVMPVPAEASRPAKPARQQPAARAPAAAGPAPPPPRQQPPPRIRNEREPRSPKPGRLLNRQER